MNDLDYIYILRALEEIPFSVGKKLLIDFLMGKEKNPSIVKNKLYLMENYGILGYTKDEINDMIENLLLNNLIKYNHFNRFGKVLELTDAGKKEIKHPELYKKKLSYNYKELRTEITEEDKKRFLAFGDILANYNDEQKKAIISNSKHILCIAGAGTGKTTVLTKRIEFLIKYKSVAPDKILAITFTRKARQEMASRLPYRTVNIETFNSFCEKTLRKHSKSFYGRDVRVTTYRDKVIMIRNALNKLNLDFKKAINIYFTWSQRRSKTDEQLIRIFLNDCFFIRDYFKFKSRELEKKTFEGTDSSMLVYNVVNYIENYMKKNGLRDFADQLLDTIKLFQEHTDFIPRYEHILIDEYQDVNSTQIKLIDILNPDNLFCVGDPRQSIYGWRGSDIKYILDFDEKFSGSEIIALTKNYRSVKPIVDLINASIRTMKLPDLEAIKQGEHDIKLLRFENEEAEFEYVIQAILNTELPKNEIFVLARTNRQLNDLSREMTMRGIKHIVRSEDAKKDVLPQEDEVILATVHSIKGMEAELVFLIGANNINFPCKASEHPVVDMVKVDEYDKEEEERRLFYVAMSRARSHLYISYTGKKPTRFINDEMLEIIHKNKFSVSKAGKVIERLRAWRKDIAKKKGLPPYTILKDKTLFDIALKMPQSEQELENINGLGPVKIMKYGQDILDIVAGLR